MGNTSIAITGMGLVSPLGSDTKRYYQQLKSGEIRIDAVDLPNDPEGRSIWSSTVDSVELREHMIRIRDLHTENVPIIVVGSPLKVWGASVRLGNVPEDVSPLNEHRGWSRPVFHEQLFIRR